MSKKANTTINIADLLSAQIAETPTRSRNNHKITIGDKTEVHSSLSETALAICSHLRDNGKTLDEISSAITVRGHIPMLKFPAEASDGDIKGAIRQNAKCHRRYYTREFFEADGHKCAMTNQWTQPLLEKFAGELGIGYEKMENA